MGDGRTAYASAFPDQAAKIDTDTALEDSDRAAFWGEVDLWSGGPPSIEDHLDECCSKFTLKGPNVTLPVAELLATAQKTQSLARGFSMQVPPGPLPAPTRAEANLWINEVLQTGDERAALDLFVSRFRGLRLRPLGTPAKKARIFAMRNPSSPGDPWAGDRKALFDSLAIPSADPADFACFAFRPDPSDDVRKPTTLDAGHANLAKFVAGGLTAGGLPEVVVTPPACEQLQRAPRSVT